MTTSNAVQSFGLKNAHGTRRCGCCSSELRSIVAALIVVATSLLPTARANVSCWHLNYPWVDSSGLNGDYSNGSSFCSAALAWVRRAVPDRDWRLVNCINPGVPTAVDQGTTAVVCYADCSENLTNFYSASAIDTCKTFVSAIPPPATQCGLSCNGIKDPINPVSGAVYDAIVDSPSSERQISFDRFYNSLDAGGPDLGAGWRHVFSRSIKAKYASTTYQPYIPSPDNSSPYDTEAAACTSGFDEIKSRVRSWANATAAYDNGLCTLSLGAVQIGTLPIFYTSNPTPDQTSVILVGLDVTRDDGQLVSFTFSGNSIVAPPGINLKLQQTSTGYLLTDANDNAESYDNSGKLQSITSRNGVVQTISYDGSGRLSSVADNFGHSLTLSYDIQNGLSKVMRQ